jgi:molecular chaperone GrpE
MFGRKQNPSNEPGPESGREQAHGETSGEGPNAPGAGEADGLAAEVESLRAQRDELNDKYLRALAEFQNYQRRAFNNEKEARQQGVSAVLTGILPVMDHFDIALTLDPAKASAQQVIDGVKVIRGELLKALQAQGIGVINPGPNEEFNPAHHQAITQQPAEGVQSGRIVTTFQPGYTLGERVVRPAKVVVAP